jgi:hypothetical protein
VRHTIEEFGDGADSRRLDEDSTQRWMSVGAMDTRKNVERDDEWLLGTGVQQKKCLYSGCLQFFIYFKIVPTFLK